MSHQITQREDKMYESAYAGNRCSPLNAESMLSKSKLTDSTEAVEALLVGEAA